MVALDKSFWPDDVRHPYRRLVVALLLGPAILGVLLTMTAFLMSRLSSGSQAESLAEALDAARQIFFYLVLFTPTVCLAGVVILWAVQARGPLPWALMGTFCGAIVGVAYGLVQYGGLEQPVLIAFGVLGWALFLVIRWLAGVRNASE